MDSLRHPLRYLFTSTWTPSGRSLAGGWGPKPTAATRCRFTSRQRWPHWLGEPACADGQQDLSACNACSSRRLCMWRHRQLEKLITQLAVGSVSIARQAGVSGPHASVSPMVFQFGGLWFWHVHAWWGAAKNNQAESFSGSLQGLRNLVRWQAQSQTLDSAKTGRCLDIWYCFWSRIPNHSCKAYGAMCHKPGVGELPCVHLQGLPFECLAIHWETAQATCTTHCRVCRHPNACHSSSTCGVQIVGLFWPSRCGGTRPGSKQASWWFETVWCAPHTTAACPPVHLAMDLQHLASLSTIVPDVLRVNLFTVLTCGLSYVAKQRANFLRKVMDMKRQLVEEEERLRATMDPHVSAVTSNKPLSLWRRLLVESGFPGVWPHGTRGRACWTRAEIKAVRPQVQAYDDDSRTIGRTSNVETKSTYWSARHDRRAGAIGTAQRRELQRSCLSGPYSTEDEVSHMLGTSDWSLNKRFVLLQGEEQKPRVIDNCRDSGVNEAYGSASYLALHDTDYVAAFLQFVSTVLANRDSVVVPLTNGDVLHGEWHGELVNCPKLLGRCVDLSKACKQIAVSPTSRKFAVLGHRTQSGGWAYYISNSLPFGASSSVFAFNKVSRGLWHLLTHQMGCLTTVFFDDFPMFEFEPLQRITTTAVSTLFDLLGWLHATTGKKAAPFDEEVSALGVKFSLKDIWEGKLTVANRQERLVRMHRMFDKFLGDKAAKKADCASLHGMLNFACGFVLGNSLKPLARAVADMAVHVAKWPALHEACLLAGILLPEVKPRVLTLPSPGFRFILYTGGAFENGRATWGAVLWDKRFSQPRVYWGRVPERL